MKQTEEIKAMIREMMNQAIQELKKKQADEMAQRQMMERMQREANEEAARAFRFSLMDTLNDADEISRFFSEEDVKRAFQFPDWPAGTEIVCYCRSTDSRNTIEQIAQRGGWKIVRYVHIDELPIAKLYKPGQVMFAKREALEWKRDSTMPACEEWCNQMLGVDKKTEETIIRNENRLKKT